MDQNSNNFNSGPTGTTGSGSTASGSSFATGGTGTGMSSGGGMSTGSGAGPSGGFGVTSATDSGTGAQTGNCPHCGQSMNRAGLDQFLGRLGIDEEMINNLKNQFQNVDIDEYLNTARDYLKNSSGKAQVYAKDNPGKVAAGVAALALGAGLIYAAVNRDRS
jgi:hypothetical protein